MTAVHKNEIQPGGQAADSNVTEENGASQITRHEAICNELDKMAAVGEKVVNFWVEGPAYCSPVRGAIRARIRSEDSSEIRMRTLHPGQARELIEDMTIFDDLNVLADESRQQPHAPVTELIWHDFTKS